MKRRDFDVNEEIDLLNDVTFFMVLAGEKEENDIVDDEEEEEFDIAGDEEEEEVDFVGDGEEKEVDIIVGYASEIKDVDEQKF